MQQYQSKKRVHAFKIDAIVYKPDGSAILVPFKEDEPERTVSKEYIDKHEPELGWYFVLHSDGYESACPGETFENENYPISGNAAAI